MELRFNQLSITAAIPTADIIADLITAAVIGVAIAEGITAGAAMAEVGTAVDTDMVATAEVAVAVELTRPNIVNKS